MNSQQEDGHINMRVAAMTIRLVTNTIVGSSYQLTRSFENRSNGLERCPIIGVHVSVTLCRQVDQIYRDMLAIPESVPGSGSSICTSVVQQLTKTLKSVRQSACLEQS